MVELIEQADCAIDELVVVMGRATIEAVLKMRAEQLAGPRQQGRRDESREVYWYGTQKVRVAPSDRNCESISPRLRKKKLQVGEQAELEIPVYEAMRKDGRLADRMLHILMHGVSMRN